MSNMGERAGLRHARKHLSAYAEHAGAPGSLRLRLVTTDDAREAFALLSQAFLHISIDQPSVEAA